LRGLKIWGVYSRLRELNDQRCLLDGRNGRRNERERPMKPKDFCFDCGSPTPLHNKGCAVNRCFTCQGDGKIMMGTNDPEHPLRAIPCPSCQTKRELDKVETEAAIRRRAVTIKKQIERRYCPSCGSVLRFTKTGKIRKHDNRNWRPDAALNFPVCEQSGGTL
jgi:hypothetical protein